VNTSTRWEVLVREPRNADKDGELHNPDSIPRRERARSEGWCQMQLARAAAATLNLSECGQIRSWPSDLVCPTADSYRPAHHLFKS
jgi:hypothetical protein